MILPNSLYSPSSSLLTRFASSKLRVYLLLYSLKANSYLEIGLVVCWGFRVSFLASFFNGF